MNSIEIKYFGHACFTLRCGGYVLALDPYDPSVPGYPPLCLTANNTLCSHGHHDHNYLRAVTMPLNEVPCPFEIEKISTFHDEKGGAFRGENTIHVITAEGLRIAHFGDLGHELDDDTLSRLGKLDLALIPIGGTYTIDIEGAVKLISRINARVVIPMHYRTDTAGYEVLMHIKDFMPLVKNVKIYEDGNFTLATDTPAQTAVLKTR